MRILLMLAILLSLSTAWIVGEDPTSGKAYGSAWRFPLDNLTPFTVQAGGYPLLGALSFQRSGGFRVGEIEPVGTGFKILREGDYRASFSAVLYGPETETKYAGCEFTVYMLINRNDSPMQHNLLSASHTLNAKQIVQFGDAGILQALRHYDMIELFLQTGCNVTQLPVNVWDWVITLERIVDSFSRFWVKSMLFLNVQDCSILTAKGCETGLLWLFAVADFFFSLWVFLIALLLIGLLIGWFMDDFMRPLLLEFFAKTEASSQLPPQAKRKLVFEDTPEHFPV